MPPAREEEQEYEEESDYENDEKIDPSLRSQCLPLDTLLPDFETEEPVDGLSFAKSAIPGSEDSKRRRLRRKSSRLR